MRACSRALLLVLSFLLLSLPLSANPVDPFARFSFVENRGQWSAPARYMLDRAGMRAWFAGDEVVYDLNDGAGKGHVLRQRFEGIAAPTLRAIGAQPGARSYIDADRSIDAASFSELCYARLYDGVDLRFYESAGMLKYDLLLDPGADPSAIRFRYDGATSLRIDEGALRVGTSMGDLIEQAPYCYQEIGGERRRVECRFVVEGDAIGFRLGAYDRGRPLVIDPAILYSSYLGGSDADAGHAITLDAAGNIYVAGSTFSASFPATTGAYTSNSEPPFRSGGIFIAKLDPTGSTLLFASTINANGAETPAAIRVRRDGAVIVAGTTASSDFPKLGPPSSDAGREDGFLLGLSSDGARLLFSRYIGGGDEDRIEDMTLGSNDDVYIVGWTRSADLFPSGTASVQPLKDGGEDGFLLRMSRNGESILNGTYLGGASDDRALAVAFESGGAVWITGWTQSGDLPHLLPGVQPIGAVSPGSRDCFVARIWFGGTGGDFKALIGSFGDDEGRSIDVRDRKPAGLTDTVYITGRAGGSGFPVTVGGGAGSVFAMKMIWDGDANLTIAYTGVYNFNGAGETIRADSLGRAYVGGWTTRNNSDLLFLRLDPLGNILDSAVIGGSGADVPARQSHLTRTFDLFLTGVTSSPSTGSPQNRFPLTRSAVDSTFNSSGLPSAATDAFVMRLGFGARPLIFSPIVRAVETLRCDTTGFVQFDVYNLGDADLLIRRSDIFGGGGGGRFVLVEPSPSDVPRTVRPGESLRYVVRYSRTTLGGDSAILRIINNSPQAEFDTFDITLRGLRAAPALYSSPPLLSFGGVCVGDSATARDTIRNGGTVPANIDSIALADGGSFRIVNAPRLPLPLSLTGSLPVTILFKPIRAGIARDTLLVRVRECDSLFRMPVEGRGDSVAVEWSVAELRLPPLPRCVAADSAVVVLTNRGNVTLHPIAALLTHTDFELRSNLPGSIPPGAAVALTIRFAPAAGVEQRRDTLRIGVGECGAELALPLFGERAPGAGLDARDTIDFGAQVVCAGAPVDLVDTLVIRNTGGDVIDSIYFVALPAPFTFVDAPAAPARIAAGDSLLLPLRFAPLSTGAHAIPLLIAYRAGGCSDTLRVELLGSREDILVEASPSLLDIPSLTACEQEADTTVAIMNRSSVIVTIDSVRLSSRGIERSVPLNPPHKILPGESFEDILILKPQQLGAIEETVTYYLAPCGDSITVTLRGRKEGIVLTPREDTLRFPARLACDLAPLMEDITIVNRGDGAEADVRSVQVTGASEIEVDTTGFIGRKIAAGEELRIPVRFAPNGSGQFRATVEVRLGPCDDILRREIVGDIDEPLLAVRGGEFGDVPIASTKSTSVVLVNMNRDTIRAEGLENLVSPFRLVGGLPATIAPGDSVTVVVEFAPIDTGMYSPTPLASITSPCSFTWGVPLSGRGVGTSSTLDDILCISGTTGGLPGDTVELAIVPRSTPRALPAPADIIYRLRYDPLRLQLIDPGGALQVESDDPIAGVATIRQAGADSVRRVVLRFRLLAGLGDSTHVRLDSAAISGTGPFAVCDDSAAIAIGSRCILVGLTFGKYRNLLEDVRPNPSGGWVEVTYQQLEDARAVLRVFDMSGREVLRPFDAEMAGGRYTFRFSVADLPAGSYFYSIEAGSYREAKQMLIER